MAEKKKRSAPKRRQKKPEDRRFQRFCAVAIALIAFWWYNNFSLKTVEETFVSDKVSAPVRITVLSDLHLGSAGVSRKTVLRGVKDAQPDVIMVLGDMYTDKSGDETFGEAVEFICSLKETGCPVYFVPGDHDTAEQYLADIAAGGVSVMNYRTESVMVNGSRLRIYGIDNAYFSQTFDLHNAFMPDESCFCVLMAHIPNYPKYADFGADLTLCADTHGGMVQLPFGIGEAYDPLTGTVFPEKSGSQPVYDKGWFGYEGGAMFITSGLGCYPAAIRLFNRPEIVTIEIVPR